MAYDCRAVMVHHNAPDFAELAVRSLLATHQPPLDMALCVYDNASTADTKHLAAFLAGRGIPFIQSSFDTQTRFSSHGDTLQRFVLDHDDCAYYLFLDHDVCFTEPNLIHRLRDELELAGPSAFGIGPRWADWSGTKEWSSPVLSADQQRRLHPFCALVRNTPLFRSVVRDFGFGQFRYEHADRQVLWETFELATQVMRSHGQRHLLSDALLMHLNGVSYSEGQRNLHGPRCHELLAALRASSSPSQHLKSIQKQSGG